MSKLHSFLQVKTPLTAAHLQEFKCDFLLVFTVTMTSFVTNVAQVIISILQGFSFSDFSCFLDSLWRDCNAFNMNKNNTLQYNHAGFRIVYFILQ